MQRFKKAWRRANAAIPPFVAPPFVKGVALGMVLTAVGFYALLYFSGAAVAVGTNPEPVAGRCFPASSWDANDAKRPCVEVGTVYEDGSGQIIQRSADDSFRVVCSLPNPKEEGRRYLAVCNRKSHAEAIPLPLPLPIPPRVLHRVERGMGLR